MAPHALIHMPRAHACLDVLIILPR